MSWLGCDLYASWLTSLQWLQAFNRVSRFARCSVQVPVISHRRFICRGRITFIYTPLLDSRRCIVDVNFLYGSLLPCELSLHLAPLHALSDWRVVGRGGNLIFSLLVDVILVIRLYAFYNRDKRGGSEKLSFMQENLNDAFKVLMFLVFVNTGEAWWRDILLKAVVEARIHSQYIWLWVTSDQHAIFDSWPFLDADICPYHSRQIYRQYHLSGSRRTASLGMSLEPHS